MNRNASYVFFAESPLDDPSTGPKGAEGVALTPGRSLAVDARVWPYGLPVFVAGRIAAADGIGEEDMARLMVAQLDGRGQRDGGGGQKPDRQGCEGRQAAGRDRAAGAHDDAAAINRRSRCRPASSSGRPTSRRAARSSDRRCA